MLRKSRLRILTPVNGTHASEQAFRWSCQLARSVRAELSAIYVSEVPMEFPLGTVQGRSHLLEGERILTNVERIAESEHCRVNTTMVEARNAGPAIVLEAYQKEFDLLVVGVPYRQSATPIAVGSTTDYLLKNASCQVVVSREPALEQPE